MVTLYVGIILLLIIIGGMLASIRGELEVVEFHCKRLEIKLDYLLNKEDMAVIPDKWRVSSEEAEKMYNAALENMRGYHKE